MASLSKAERDFWIMELDREISKEIDKVVAEYGSDPRTDAMETATRALEESCGIPDMIQEWENLNEAEDEASETLSRIRDKKNAVSNQIKDLVEQRMPVPRGYYRGGSPGWKEGIRQRAMMDVPEILRSSYGEAGERISELVELKESVPKTIMLATSQPQLRSFLQMFAAKYRVDAMGKSIEQ